LRKLSKRSGAFNTSRRSTFWTFYGAGAGGGSAGGGSGGGGSAAGGGGGAGSGAGAGAVFWLQATSTRPAKTRTNRLIAFDFMRNTSISPSSDDGKKYGASDGAPAIKTHEIGKGG
jgi:hypothetical protein